MDDQCNPNVGIPNIINMQEAGVDAIFAMPCSGGKDLIQRSHFSYKVTQHIPGASFMKLPLERTSFSKGRQFFPLVRRP